MSLASAPWHFLSLVRFAEIAQKSHATYGMVSSYATNDHKLLIQPIFHGVQVLQFGAHLRKT